MRARPSSPAAAMAVTTCLLASLLPAADARSLGSTGGIFQPRRSVPPITNINSHSNFAVKANGGSGACPSSDGCPAASRAVGRIPGHEGNSLKIDLSVSDESLEEVLSLRGGGLFGGRKKDENAAADGGDNNTDEDGDDDEGGLYPLMDDALAAASDAVEEALADDNDDGAANAHNGDSTDIEIDMSSDGNGGDGPSRTVEVQATSRHLFSRDPDRPKQSLLSRIFPTSPILPAERSTFLALSTMMFLFIYVFTTVRDTKDALVVSHCGAESIPYLKLYGVLPCALVFIVAYSKASNLLGKEALFYVTLVPFFVFYSLFAFVLYPNRDSIHFPMLGGVDTVADAAPGPLSLIRYWSFSLYFIVSELWASAGVPLLFWQCANDVTSLPQAKRFYPLFAVFGNFAPIVSGKVMSLLVSLQKTNDDVGFQSTLQGLASIKNSVCLGIVVLYHLVYDLADKRQRREEKERINDMLVNAKKGDTVEVEVTFGGKTVKKTKPTMRQSLSELSKSWELKSMATMVVCYNLCIELTEVLWKALLRKTYTTKSAYMDFMATFSQTVGWVTIVMQLIAPSIIRTLGWKGSAMLVPLSMGAFAIWFFTSAAGIDGIGEAVGSAASPLTTALLIGTLLNVVSKVTKYSLFDPCKEMAYIPLGPEAKVKGKAAVDVFGARLGRSIGSASQQLIMLASGGAASSIIQFVPFLGVLYMTALGFWSNAVWKLGHLFDKKVEPEQPSALSGLIRVRLDSDREHILSVEAEHHRRETYEDISN